MVTIWNNKCYSTLSHNLIQEFMKDVYSNLPNNYRANSASREYNQIVYTILMEYKKDPSCCCLKSLQMKIENLTTEFDENNIFKESSNIIQILIGNNKECAKDYLLSQILDKDLYDKYIHPLGKYTLEAIIIYVLGILFYSISESSVVRVATLIDKLDSAVCRQADIIANRKDMIINKEDRYKIGTLLYKFMLERGLIDVELMKTNELIQSKKGFRYKNNLFVICNFELKHLPLKLNLPMVCMPENWKIKDAQMTSGPIMLSDMCGGYLSEPTADLYNRFKVISTHNINNFNIELNKKNIRDMCFILNGLQKQGFKVNKRMLEFIKRNRDTLEREGILMPRKLAYVNMKDAYDKLRLAYFKNDEIKKVTSIGNLFQQFSNEMKVAMFDESIINIATAYEDYVFYLPAFMDFRGRIYRSGIFHFHERDIARSLIVFDKGNQDDNLVLDRDILYVSAAFKYNKFSNYEKALEWVKSKKSFISSSDESLISFVKGASDPFQFISKFLCERMEEYKDESISQDASSSAYQIMSYLLLNTDMAVKTNLIPHPDGQIQDVYMHMHNELKDYLCNHFEDDSKMLIIESKLSRKLVKKLFMPLIYGKTIITMINDLRETYKLLLSDKDCNKLAKLCKSFWSHKYPDIENLMKLITIISWFCSEMGKPVIYSIPFFTTKQDYMCFTKENISVYEKLTKKRRRITIQVPTTIRDKRKTQAAACANFIHQKDAYIAMKVSESLLKIKAPIYTVHDNFITTLPYVKLLPDIYCGVFQHMGHPLFIINSFIHMNLFNTFHNDIDRTIPISSNQLTDLMIPLCPCEKRKNKWEDKVSELVQLYSYYVKGSSQEERWKEFKCLIMNRTTNFSLQF